MNPKIAEHHRSRPAYIYLRQSTPSQVRHHQESTERQYALRQKALELGWSESLIHTLDRDLGKTGTEMAGREDFKTLVAEVSMGQVGAVFALEVSRLARSNLDWHRLLELCALTETLVIDEDGCYDPADFNDGLLLGLNRPETQSTPCSTSCRPLRAVFRVGSQTPLTRRQSIPPTDVSHVLRSEPPTKGAAQTHAIQTSRDLFVAAPWRQLVNFGNRFVGSL